MAANRPLSAAAQAAWDASARPGAWTAMPSGLSVLDLESALAMALRLDPSADPAMVQHWLLIIEREAVIRMAARLAAERARRLHGADSTRLH